MKQAKTPFGTITIILACLVVAALALGNEQIMWNWGFIPKPAANLGFLSQLKTIVSSLFVHVDPLHLMGNLVALAGIGPVVENAVGTVRFAIIYLASGLIGAALHALMTTAAQPSMADQPMIGASACVGGLIGYSWLRFYRTKVPVFPKVGAPVYVLVAVWVLLQLLGGLEANRMVGAPIAYWAHIGGFLSGFALGIVFRAGHDAKKEAWQQRLQEASNLGPASQIAAAREYLEHNPNDLAVRKVLVEGLLRDHREDEALTELRKLSLDSPAFEQGYAWATLADLQKLGTMSVEERYRAATQLKQELPEIAERVLASVMEEPACALTADCLLMLIEITSKTDQEGARHFAAQLKRDFELAHQTETAKRHWPELF